MNQISFLFRSLYCLCFFFASYALRAQIIHITPSGAGDHSGSTWSNAAAGNDLQSMINGATAGTQIWVAAGTYKPNASPNGCSGCNDSRNYSFMLKNDLAIYGGFSGIESELDQRSVGNNPTILSGDIGIPGDMSDNCYHVVLSLVNTNTSVLDGFTISDGNANSPTNTNVYTPYINYVSSGSGGGLVIQSSAVQVKNCIFYNNSSANFFHPGGGGAIFINYSNPALTNCIFVSNKCDAGSAIQIFNSSSPFPITNCTFSGNNGTVIYNIDSAPRLFNCVIWNNQGISFYAIGDNPIIGHSLVQGGSNSNGNLNIDPMFVNSNDPDGQDNILGNADDGLRFQYGSPAIDAGDNTAASFISTDITSAIRIQDGAVDLGAYEEGACRLVLYVDSSIDVSGDGASWATAFKEVRDALALAHQCGDVNTILVAKGTYKPTGDNNRENSFGITRGGLKIYGGYDASTGIRNIKDNSTILSGEIGNEATTGDNSYQVLVVAGLASNADSVIVDGFTITKGNNTGSASDRHINGFLIYGDRGAGFIFDTDQSGGRLSMRNCHITGNYSAKWGGGGYIVGSAPSIVNCIFSNNSAAGPGGGICLHDYELEPANFINCIFYANTAYNGFAIASVWGAVGNLINCTIIGNNSNRGQGSAVFNIDFNIINCVIWGNNGNNGIESGRSNPKVSHSIVQGTAIYPGTGNLNSDPLLVNAADADGADNLFGTADDGLRLSCISPAINKGDNDAITGVLTDIRGAARIQHSVVDMGAYESPYATPSVPSVTIAANPGSTVCSGTGVIFTATPLNGGENPVYQWKRNGTNVGNNSATYTASGLEDKDTITVQLTSNADCVYPAGAFDTLVVTVNSLSTPTSFSATACNSYTLPWGDEVAASGDYVHTYTNTKGCDSMVTVHVTINHASTPTSFNAAGCGSYTLPWGTVANLSGNYVYTYTNTKGCDSIVTVYVTINHASTPTSFNAAGCGSYTLPWGAVATASGDYTHHYTNINGCDSTVTAHVTITSLAKPVITADGSTNFCNGGSVVLTAPAGFSNYQWSNNATGQTLKVTQSGAYSVIVSNGSCNSPSSNVITVAVGNDAQKPVITSPADVTLCYAVNDTYTIAPLKATDNCSIASTTYKITGATTRSGNSLDASGKFNPGMSAVTWTVKDAAGNTSTGQTKVVVNEKFTVAIPDTWAIGSGCEMNTVYKGYTPASLTILAVKVSGGKAPYTYKWSNGACTPIVIINPASATTYTVTVKDAKGCIQVASKQIKVVDIRCGSKMDMVSLCYKGKTLCIAVKDVAGYLLKGAYLGSCNPSTARRGTEQLAAVAKELAIEGDLDVKAFPNPSTAYFKLMINSSNVKDKVSISILDNMGRVIETKTVVAGQTVLIGGNYRPGIYLAKAVQANKSVSVKLIRQ